MVNSKPLSLTVKTERWPIAGDFTISRGSKAEAVVVFAELSDGAARGRGECVPYARYGDTVDKVVAAIEEMRAPLKGGLDRMLLQKVMPAGAARNALDCAFWDLEAKRAGRTVASLIGITAPRALTTAYTISLGLPSAMAAAAAKVATWPLLKVKLGGNADDGGDAARIAAVREVAPNATLIVDVNEGWSPQNLAANLAACDAANVALIEQPLPANADDALTEVERTVPICADESAHNRASLAALGKKYDAVNIKLDKAGGLTEALAMSREARLSGIGVMVGCMVATSLSMAPAALLAQHARYVDLDGPLLLARDREHGLRYDGSLVYPPQPELWG